MKHTLLTSIIAITLAATASAAEVQITLGGVHNCCNTCTKDIEKAVDKLRDTKVAAKGGTVTLTCKTKAEAKKAVDALFDAGYYGTIEGGEVSVKAASPGAGADKKVKSATVSGVHNCCDKCRAAIRDAVKAVPGVEDADVVAKNSTFKVTGDFTKGEVIAALNKAGFAPTVK